MHKDIIKLDMRPQKKLDITTMTEYYVVQAFYQGKWTTLAEGGKEIEFSSEESARTYIKTVKE